MDEGTRETIVQLLNETLAELEKEKDFANLVESMRHRREETPALLESIDDELSKPQEEMPVEYSQDADSTELELPPFAFSNRLRMDFEWGALPMHKLVNECRLS